jgi:putative DNA primase/helicase
LVPFTVEISPVDKNFKASLRPEWPGILAWAIQGCLEWQRRGLDPPPTVLDATGEYFADQDTLGRWFSERCNPKVNAETGSSHAYGDWKVWAESEKEYVISHKSFTQGLVEKGFKKTKDGLGNVVFIGFELRNG